MTSPTATLRSLGGVARTATLRRRGVSEKALTLAVRSGEILRPRQGVYAVLGTPQPVLHAAAHGGVPACATAARLHGLWVLDDSELHIWLGRGGGRRTHACGQCRAHWDDGAVVAGQLPTVARTLLQLARCGGDEAFFVSLESALRQSKLPPADIAWLRRRLPPRMRRLLAFARADADSGLESLMRLRLWRLGITVRCQVLVRGVGEVDFVIGDRLLIEVDGRENHDGASERHKDLLRDARAAALGFETLRFDYALILHDWPTVERAILAKVAAGAHLLG